MVPIYVIIPVYNATKTLKDTVASVLCQQYHNIKIILVDDGSTDNSLDVCYRLAQLHRNIQVIHQNNGGVSKARNTGIAHALQDAPQNAYFAFLDADDFWYPHFLTDQLVEELGAAQNSIYAFGTITCNEQADSYSPPQPYHKGTISGGLSAIWSLQNHFGANLYHVSLFRKWNVRFLEGYKYSEDKFMRVLCSFFAANITFCPQIMYIYRENRAGAMAFSSRISAVEYFTPIIDGWMQTEKIINSFSDVTGVTTDLGHVLGNVYLLDMITTHYMQQGSCKEIQKIVEEHPNYPYLVNMKPMGQTDANYHKKVLFFAHPIFFAVKYRIWGVVQSILRYALKIPAVEYLNERRKHPLHYLP